MAKLNGTNETNKRDIFNIDEFLCPDRTTNQSGERSLPYVLKHHAVDMRKEIFCKLANVVRFLMRLQSV